MLLLLQLELTVLPTEWLPGSSWLAMAQQSYSKKHTNRTKPRNVVPVVPIYLRVWARSGGGAVQLLAV